MSIRKKLLTAFGIIGLFAGIIGFMAIKINASIGLDIAQISHASINEAKAADGMSEALHDLEIALLRAQKQKNTQAWQSEAATAALARFETNLFQFRETVLNALAMAKTEGDAEEIADANEDANLVKEIEEKFGQLK